MFLHRRAVRVEGRQAVWNVLPAVAVSGPWAAGEGGAPEALRSARVTAVGSAIATGVVLTALGIAVVLVQHTLSRRALTRRVSYQLVPTNSFDPSGEDVRRFAEQLRRTRTTVSWLVPRRARAVRVHLTTGRDGRLAYRVEGHQDARSVLRQQTYAQVELRMVDSPQASLTAASGSEEGPLDEKASGVTLQHSRPARKERRGPGEVRGSDGMELGGVPTHGRPTVTPAKGGRSGDSTDHRRRGRQTTHVARAELILATDAALPLRSVPLKPDPLQSLAAAAASVNTDLGERVDVCVDLLPLTPARVAFLRRCRARRDEQGAPHAGWVGAAMRELRSDWRGSRRESLRSAVPAGAEPLGGKFGTDEPVFAAQVLVQVQSEIPGRAEAHLHQVLAAFDLWTGENRWRVRGIGLGVGPTVLAHFGADSVWRRRGFDRRFATGECLPHRRTVLTSSELAGLLKPPTRWCAHLNVVRSGGMVPPAPRELPVYTGQPGVIPLGYTAGHDGSEQLLGMRLADLTFSFRVGKSRYGKTEEALAQAAAIAYGGGGVWFLDPHADGWRRVRPYLTHPAVRNRVWELDLTVRDDASRICSWNPLSMHRRGVADIEVVVDTIVTAVAAALSWGDSAPRATAILSKTCQTLCELGLRLPADAQPTLFQIRTLLDDEDWRAEILPHLPRDLRSYWTRAFPKLPGDATPVITNLIERLSASRTLRAFFGASQSTYDVRRAMDTGRVVFVCPPGEGAISKLVSCFLIFDLFRAGRSRVDLPANRRRRFDAFIDELTAVDGVSKGYIASILEQLGKFEVWLHAMTQMAPRLTPATRDALLNNQTLLCSTACEVDAAKLITKQWGRIIEPDTLVDLPKYHHIMTTVVDGAKTTPFKVRGPEFTELYADKNRPDLVPQLNEAINRSMRRRRIGEILADQETLDARILDHLNDRTPARPTTNLQPTGNRAEPQEPGTGAGRPSAPGGDAPATEAVGEFPYTASFE